MSLNGSLNYPIWAVRVACRIPVNWSCPARDLFRPLRHKLALRAIGYPNRAGAARPRGREHDDDLHPRPQSGLSGRPESDRPDGGPSIGITCEAFAAIAGRGRRLQAEVTDARPDHAAFSCELATMAAPDTQPLPPSQSSRRLAPGLERCSYPPVQTDATTVATGAVGEYLPTASSCLLHR